MIKKVNLQTFLEGLKNRNYAVRYKAARALGELGDKKAIEPFLKVMHEDNNYIVKLNAVYALRVMKE